MASDVDKAQAEERGAAEIREMWREEQPALNRDTAIDAAWNVLYGDDMQSLFSVDEQKQHVAHMLDAHGITDPQEAVKAAERVKDGDLSW